MLMLLQELLRMNRIRILRQNLNRELRVNSTEDLIKYLKIKGRVELCNHNRANEITTTTTTTLAPGYDK